MMTVIPSDTDFESTLLFESPPEAVFDTLVTPSAFADWWMPATGSADEDGELTFLWGDAGTVVRIDSAPRPSAVSWTVLSCGAPLEDWVGTTISFTIEATASGGSRVRFRHAGLAQLECFGQCRKGWEQYLPALVGLVDEAHSRRAVAS
jgi:uncharacterized protein YndB with AHSA1/START domain